MLSILYYRYVVDILLRWWVILNIDNNGHIINIIINVIRVYHVTLIYYRHNVILCLWYLQSPILPKIPTHFGVTINVASKATCNLSKFNPWSSWSPPICLCKCAAILLDLDWDSYFSMFVLFTTWKMYRLPIDTLLVCEKCSKSVNHVCFVICHVMIL